MKYFIGFIFLTLLTSCATNDRSKEKAILHMNLGVAQLESGRYPEALKELILADELDPDNPIILNNLSLAYYVREKYGEALDLILRTLRLKPDYSDGRNNYGRILIALGKYDQAISELDRVVKDLTFVAPEKAYTNLGVAYFKKGNFPVAKKMYAKAVSLNRAYCPAYSSYGQTLFENKEYEKASQILDQALSKCERMPEETHYYSALSYYKAGQSDKAIARFEEIIKLYPESEFAHKSESMLKIIKQ